MKRILKSLFAVISEQLIPIPRYPEVEIVDVSEGKSYAIAKTSFPDDFPGESGTRNIRVMLQSGDERPSVGQVAWVIPFDFMDQTRNCSQEERERLIAKKRLRDEANRLMTHNSVRESLIVFHLSEKETAERFEKQRLLDQAQKEKERNELRELIHLHLQ